MYKLMIVDNDRQARERLTGGIDLGKLGITLCAEVDNGIQAIELFMRHRPEIVITEINIPLINGMDAAKQILQVESNTKVIVVTNSATMDHARDAVRYGMVDFMPKPADLRELESALRRIVSRMQSKRRQDEQQQRMKELLERGMPMIRGDYFTYLMQTPTEQIDTADCVQHLQDFGIPAHSTCICTAILVPSYGTMAQEKQRSAQLTLTEELENILQPLGIGTVVVYDNMQRTVLIAYADQGDLAQTVARRLSLLRDKMRYIYRQDFHAAVGDPVRHFAELSKSKESAEFALCYWTTMGENHIISSAQLRNVDLPPVQIPSVSHADVMTMLTGSDPGQLGVSLEHYLRQAAYETRNSVHSVQLLAIELMATLIGCAREVGGSVEALRSERPAIYVRIMQQSSIHEVINVVLAAAKSISESIRGRREENKVRALSDAKWYVTQHYAEPDLCLAKVAEYVNLSPSYVSQLFKRMDDSTFTEYLNRVRIEQAKRLLSTTHMRVYEVADAVGYQSSKYFFQLFKQITGKRPREFYQVSGVGESEF